MGVRPVHEWRIYLDASAEIYVVVDEIDYRYFSKWKWNCHKTSQRHWGKKGTKRYARRSQSNGKRYKPPIYLHVAIMKRTGEPPPTELHTLVDHEDGDEFNCRRYNLRWVTPSQNSLNRKNRKRRVKDEHAPQAPTPEPIPF